MINVRTRLFYGIGGGIGLGGIALALAFAVTSSLASAQTDQAAPKGRGGPGTPQQGMMAGQMMGDMQAAQKKLDGLVSAMNGAKGPEKVDRIAALLTELVGQHRQMHTRMMSMGGMMQPTQPAPTAAAPSPGAPAADDHAEHHPKP
jgi:hypothetical protein